MPEELARRIREHGFLIPGPEYMEKGADLTPVKEPTPKKLKTNTVY